MLILLRHIFTAYTHLLMVPRAPKSDTSFPNVVVVVVVVCRRSHVCCLTLFAFSLKEQKQRKMKKQSVHSVCTVICCLLFTFRSRWNLFFGFFISSCFLIFFFSAESEILLETHLFLCLADVADVVWRGWNFSSSWSTLLGRSISQSRSVCLIL